MSEPTGEAATTIAVPGAIVSLEDAKLIAELREIAFLGLGIVGQPCCGGCERGRYEWSVYKHGVGGAKHGEFSVYDAPTAELIFRNWHHDLHRAVEDYKRAAGGDTASHAGVPAPSCRKCGGKMFAGDDPAACNCGAAHWKCYRCDNGDTRPGKEGTS